MTFVTSSFLFLVVMPGAPSSLLDCKLLQDLLTRPIVKPTSETAKAAKASRPGAVRLVVCYEVTTSCDVSASRAPVRSVQWRWLLCCAVRWCFFQKWASNALSLRCLESIHRSLLYYKTRIALLDTVLLFVFGQTKSVS